MGMYLAGIYTGTTSFSLNDDGDGMQSPSVGIRNPESVDLEESALSYPGTSRGTLCLSVCLHMCGYGLCASVNADMAEFGV
jgi:hypothetical protein